MMNAATYFDIRHSLFLIPCSLFDIPCSLFDIFLLPALGILFNIVVNLFCYYFFFAKKINNLTCTAYLY